MGDFGIKISKEGKNVNTSVLTDTSFDSRYSSLMLLEKKTIEFTAPQGVESPYDTETYAHGLGYPPLVMATVDYTAASNTYSNGPIPYNYTVEPGGAFAGHFLFSYINIDVTSTNIEVDWEVMEYLPGESYELSGNVDYTVTVYIYSFKLGSSY
jgi:hypothetical protein